MKVAPVTMQSPSVAKARMCHRITCDSLASFEVSFPIHTDIPARLTDRIHHMCLVDHIPLAKRDEVLEVICQELAAYVNAVMLSAQLRH
jgi:hypothetical protein